MFKKFIKNKGLAGILFLGFTLPALAINIPGTITLQLHNPTAQNLLLTPIYNINDCAEKNFQTAFTLAAYTQRNLEGYATNCKGYDVTFAVAFKVQPIAANNKLPGGTFAFTCSAETKKCSLSQTAFPLKLRDGSLVRMTNTPDARNPNSFIFKFVTE